MHCNARRGCVTPVNARPQSGRRDPSYRRGYFSHHRDTEITQTIIKNTETRRRYSFVSRCSCILYLGVSAACRRSGPQFGDGCLLVVPHHQPWPLACVAVLAGGEEEGERAELAGKRACRAAKRELRDGLLLLGALAERHGHTGLQVCGRELYAAHARLAAQQRAVVRRAGIQPLLHQRGEVKAVPPGDAGGGGGGLAARGGPGGRHCSPG